MRTFIYFCGLYFLLGSSACTDRDILEIKPGPRLPAVINLAAEQVSGQDVHLTWDIPAGIPPEVEQPVDAVVQVTEIVNTTKSVPVLSITLPGPVKEYHYTLPDPVKTYHLTVRLYGRKKETDPNYSSDIYSVGQTVVYSP